VLSPVVAAGAAAARCGRAPVGRPQARQIVEDRSGQLGPDAPVLLVIRLHRVLGPFVKVSSGSVRSLTVDQVWAIEQTLANGRLEGWDPDRADVADLIDQALGRLTLTEYVARGS